MKKVQVEYQTIDGQQRMRKIIQTSIPPPRLQNRMKSSTFFPLLFSSSALAFQAPLPQAGFGLAQKTSITLHATRVDLPEKERNPRDVRFAWDKGLPKKSLASIGQTHTATPWILNTIEAAHWLTIPPCFVASYAIMEYHDVWYRMFDGDSLRVLLWLLAPMVTAVAGLAPTMSHIYEDWQIAPSVDPNSETYDRTVYVDGRLREISYTLLFLGLSVAALMTALA